MSLITAPKQTRLSLLSKMLMLAAIQAASFGVAQAKSDSPHFNQQLFDRRPATILTAPQNNSLTGIVPHHNVAAPLIHEFMFQLPKDVETIFIIGPNHENIGAPISTTTRNWQTNFGQLRSDEPKIKELLKLNDVSIDNELVLNDQTVSALTDYIKFYLPDAKVVPVLLKAHLSDTQTNLLRDKLRGIPGKNFFMFSVDFSHYLKYEDALAHDRELYSYLKFRNIEKIRGLESSYLDSDSAIVTLLKLNQSLGSTKMRLLQHSNNFLMSGIPTDKENMTTYFTILYSPVEPLKISAVGDIMLARSIGDLIDRNKPEWFFENVKKELDYGDFSFGNLESVISDKGTGSGSLLSFRAKPNSLAVLQAGGFDFLSMVNNHQADWGRAAWSDSFVRLKKAGITPIGQYNQDPINVTVRDINGHLISFIAASEIGIYTPEKLLLETVVKENKTSDIVIVSVHWGVEYQTKHTASQEKLAHALVDNGADLIIGHHPHVVQDVEEYNGKLIFYSLGNFLFDQWWSEATQRGVIAQIVLDQSKQSYKFIHINMLEKKVKLSK